VWLFRLGTERPLLKEDAVHIVDISTALKLKQKFKITLDSKVV
jgi:hypothetical protein